MRTADLRCETPEQAGKLLDFLFRQLNDPLARECERAFSWWRTLTFERAAEWVDFMMLLPQADRCRVGIERIRVWSEPEGEFYEPQDDGNFAFILPVYRIDPETWREFVWSLTLQPGLARNVLREVVDLVALHPHHPDRWARRTGRARELGEVDHEGEDDVAVWRRPWSWLKSGGDGLCCLSTHRADIFSMLIGVPGIIAEDRRHAAELRAICERPYPVPRITVA